MSSDKKKIVSIQRSSPQEMPAPKKPVSRAELDLVLNKARELAKKAPQKAAMILTDWLNKPRKLDNARAPTSVPKKKAG